MKKQAVSVFSVLLALMILMSSAVPVFAKKTKNYSENGTWTRKIGKTTWYFDVNDYTSEDPGSKYLGVVYIMKGKTNYKKFKYAVNAEYYKVKKNTYRIKYKGGTITFKVGAKTMTLKQNRGTVKKTKLNGSFKLLKRHYS